MLETPSAVAASICLLARWRSGSDDAVSKIAVAAVGLRHPRPCGWCVYPTPELLAMVEEHNAADSQGYLTHGFRSLPATAQRDLVDAAQALEPEAPPAPRRKAKPTDPVDELEDVFA